MCTTFPQQSIHSQAPVIWNQLPVFICHSTSVSSFKSSLKTFLFIKTVLQSYCPDIQLCVYVCVCVCVCVLCALCKNMHACIKCMRVHVCVCGGGGGGGCAFMWYALNFENIHYVHLKNV